MNDTSNNGQFGDQDRESDQETHTDSPAEPMPHLNPDPETDQDTASGGSPDAPEAKPSEE